MVSIYSLHLFDPTLITLTMKIYYDHSSITSSSLATWLTWMNVLFTSKLGEVLVDTLLSGCLYTYSNRSLLPRQDPPACKRNGSGVLSKLSFHMKHGCFPIWELKSDWKTRDYMCVRCKWSHFWTKYEKEEICLPACFWLSQEALWPYQSLVNAQVRDGAMP